MSEEVWSYWASVRSLEDEEVYQRALLSIPPFRAEKARRFAFAKDRRLSIGAWLLLDHALQMLGCPFNGQEPTLNEFGKPSFSGGPFFNLSHSGTVVMCSVSLECPVGCDVERMRTFDESLARFCMQPSEVDEMLALPVHRKSDAFYRRWTLKESYMKAHGKGLSIPPESFAIRYTSKGEPLASNDADCKLIEFPGVGEYRLAACALGRTARFEPVKRIRL